MSRCYDASSLLTKHLKDGQISYFNHNGLKQILSSMSVEIWDFFEVLGRFSPYTLVLVPRVFFFDTWCLEHVFCTVRPI